VFCSVQSVDSCSEVNVSCGGNKDYEGHDMCMVATGFLFVALKIQKSFFFSVKPTMNRRKRL